MSQECQVLCLSWHPKNQSHITAGGFRRLYEIILRSPHPIVLLDRYPSLYKTIANAKLTVKEYGGSIAIPTYLQNKFPYIFPVLDRLISFFSIIILGLQLKQSTPSIIYVPFSELSHLSLAGLILKYLTGSKLVLCNLNINIYFFDRLVNQLTHRFADEVLTISQSLDLNKTGISANHVNGVGFDRPHSLTVAKKRYDCIFIGRHTSEKGFSDLIKIWSELINRIHQPLSLVTIGDISPILLPHILNQISEAKLQNFITLKGNISDQEKSVLISESRICVFPSFFEGWGIVPMECLSQGLPVVAYDLPVYTESIGKSSAFLTLPPGDISAFAKTIVHVSHNYVKYSRAAQKWHPRLDWATVAKGEWEILCQN